MRSLAGPLPAGGVGGADQRRFSNLAIETTLVLGAVLHLPLRQSEGFVRSLMEMMKLDLAVPDHTTLARRRRTVDVHNNRWSRAIPHRHCHRGLS
jgi:hypothetical protein